MTEAPSHVPVLLQESLEGLKVQAGRWYIDGTFGAGGHTRAILEAGGKVLAIDRDPAARHFLPALRATLPEDAQLEFAQGDFRDLTAHAEAANLREVAGILLDLGVSSMQLDEGERGFAFRQGGPLDMRMGASGPTAADLVNDLPQDELAALLYRYGEERHSRRIARAIAEARERSPIATTEALVEIIRRAYPPGHRRDHPARRSFQALRIAVNDELGALEQALAAAERLLAEGGRLVVISYHSLEDRIVKHFLRQSPVLAALSKKPLGASERELEDNPRARSAKLRAAEKRSSA